MAHVSCRKEYGTLTLVVHIHYLTSGTIQSIPTRHVNHLEPMKPKPCSFQYHHHFRTGIACEDQGRSRSDRQACTTSSLFLATGFIDYCLGMLQTILRGGERKSKSDAWNPVYALSLPKVLYCTVPYGTGSQS